ncbi:monocarboxylate transporter 12 [Periplaneta americana]|uniref:monocarboxylate transporter 12 n=1 Tax=Periplaneta americana TaxID=6978 RepID=UPI0037E9603E
MTILRAIPEHRPKKEMEPPDGGWGWMVVLGVAITNMTNQSMVSVFGLLYGDLIISMGHGTTGAAVIMNLMSAVTNLSGFLIGPMIKQFSYRKAAVVGGILVASGVILTSGATYMWQMIITYSILAGLGLGLLNPATFVAVNSYFSSRRGRAVGLGLAGTGLGQMAMPQIVRSLLDEYGYKGTVLFLGGLALHSLVGASLFQPVEWHQRPGPQSDVELAPLKTTHAPDDVETRTEGGRAQQQQQAARRKMSLKEVAAVPVVGCWSRVVEVMDLDLLRDPVFVNLALGLAFVYTAGINFSLVFPFFLQDTAGLTRSQTALCMSVLASADISSRLLLPQITDRLKARSRTTFLVGAVSLGVIRSVTAEARGLYVLIAISAINGFIRGSTVVNQNLALSEYCSKEKVPAALGINMVAKGIGILTFGPMLGWLRDATGSFPLCIHAMSALIFASMTSWIVEIIIMQRRKR